MANIYLPFGTVEGQTARIAEYLAYVIREHGHQARTADLQTAGDVLPDDCDAVIVGASVHMGKHEPFVTDFVLANRAALERLPSALFSAAWLRTATRRMRKAMWRSLSRRPAGGPRTWACSPGRCSTLTTGSSSGT